MRGSISLRRATAADADALSALAFRSKTSWGYDREFMERAHPALSVPAQYLEESAVYVLMRDGAIAGFFGFIVKSGEAVLNDFWIEPASIGTGLGRILWQHVLERAAALGYGKFLIQSDPNAEGFYLHMGAQRAGTRIAPETGRALPLLQYDMRESPKG